MKTYDGSVFGAQNACFGCGPHHGSGFRLSFADDGDDLVTRFTPAEQHQGAPGIMHGGLVCTVADELAAWVLVAKRGRFGFTTKLESRFVRPVRIGVEVVGRARIARSTGRTAYVEVSLAQDGEEAFAAGLQFVILDRGGAEKLMGRPLPEEWAPYCR